MILWVCFVESSIIDSHSPLPGLFSNQDGIGKPVGMEDLPDEPGCQEFGDFLAYGPAPFVVEATQALFDGLRAWGKA